MLLKSRLFLFLLDLIVIGPWASDKLVRGGGGEREGGGVTPQEGQGRGGKGEGGQANNLRNAVVY